MGAALKFIIDGDSSAFEANMKRTERVIQQAAQNAFVFQQTIAKKSVIDPEQSRAASVEEASRSIKARALRRQRVEAEELRKGLLIEQELRDKAAVIEAQREEARRNIRARKLRRDRQKEQEERARERSMELLAIRNRASGLYDYDPNGGMMGGPGGMRGKPGWLRKFGMNGGIASEMFISVARDSTASLASGANPMTVFMQQAPQVAQALTMMGTGVVAALGTLAPAILSLATTIGLAKTIIDAKKAKQEEETTKLAADSMDYFTDKIAVAQLHKYSARMNPGEAEGLIKDLFGTQGDTRKQMVEYITYRLNQIRKNDPTPEQAEATDKLSDMNEKMFTETMDGFAKQRRVAKVAFEERKKQIEELQKKAGDPGANDAVTAYDLNRKQYAAELSRIDKEQRMANMAGPRQLTERERIGFSTNSPGLLVANRQLEVQKKIEKNTLDTLKALNSRVGDAVYFN